jgi:hypothetical protein
MLFDGVQIFFCKRPRHAHQTQRRYHCGN